LIEGYLEKYAKKLIGRTDIEDALKRLDKLTHEEAWMGIAQNLKATHAVGESVREVVDNVAGVSDRLASVDNTVKDVNVIVASVDDRVKVVDDRVAEVIRGA
jgi:ABC-type transporter Mla subunit MlaD